MHLMMFTLVIVAAIVVTAVLFVFWVALMIFRGISRLFLGPGLKRPAQRTVSSHRDPPYTRRCPQVSCKANNPAEARFCRRCGNRLDEPSRVPVRRVAML
ncbi:MAG TPA: zinc ribbon domain-containing protein [Tepidisphaeraceae bacterium]|jgi:hypothetical protein